MGGGAGSCRVGRDPTTRPRGCLVWQEAAPGNGTLWPRASLLFLSKSPPGATVSLRCKGQETDSRGGTHVLPHPPPLVQRGARPARAF